MLVHGKAFADFPSPEKSAKKAIDDLVRWTDTLREGRRRTGFS